MLDKTLNNWLDLDIMNTFCIIKKSGKNFFKKLKKIGGGG